LRTAIASRILARGWRAPFHTSCSCRRSSAEPGGTSTTTDPVHSWSRLCRALSIASVRRNGRSGHRGKWRAPGGPTVPARCCCCCGAVGRHRPAGARQGRGRRQRPSLSAPTASDARLDRSYSNSSESRASSSDDPFFFPCAHSTG
jgi:hypothetical protein